MRFQVGRIGSILKSPNRRIELIFPAIKIWRAKFIRASRRDGRLLAQDIQTGIT